MVTLNDIAKMANVSKSTVSRYLNNGAVSQKTREKLDKIVKETGYQPKVKYGWSNHSPLWFAFHQSSP